MGVSGVPISKVPGIYKLHLIYNGRPAYKKGSMYLFFVDKAPARWVVEDVLGKDWAYGYIRHEGNDSCPEQVPADTWAQVWKGQVDPRVKVQCAGTYRFSF